MTRVTLNLTNDSYGSAPNISLHYFLSRLNKMSFIKFLGTAGARLWLTKYYGPRWRVALGRQNESYPRPRAGRSGRVLQQ